MEVEQKAQVTKPGKSKPLAVTLAVFFGYWSWLYTSRYDAWKFFLGLVTHIVVIIVGVGIFAVVGVAVWLAMIVVAIINQASRNNQFFDSYHTRERPKLSTKDIIVRVVISVIVFGTFVGWQASVTEEVLDNITNNEVSQQQQASSVGSSVRDAGLEFKVSSFECGHESVAFTDIFGDPATKEAQNGQFCILEFGVTNIENTGDSISSADQVIISSRRSIKEDEPLEYSAQGYLLDDVPGNCSSTSVVAGASISCKAYFDIPADEDIIQARFHADLFSSGNVVKLK